jgi:hypothetical protein
MNASSGVRASGSGLLVSLDRDLDLDDVADQEAPCLQSHIPVQAKVFAVDLRPGLEADGLRRTRHGHLSTSGEFGIQHHFARDSSNRQVSDHLCVILALWLNTGAFERHDGRVRDIQEVGGVNLGIKLLIFRQLSWREYFSSFGFGSAISQKMI